MSVNGKSPLYIAIEGVKGSGKSTVLTRVYNHILEQGMSVRLAAPTRVGYRGAFTEMITRILPILRKIDLWNELLYAFRSYRASKLFSGNTEIILGDRSIVSSYVTRWNKWGNPDTTISRVNWFEPFIPAPDYIFYLKVETETALARISNRAKRDYGLEDQTAERITEAIQVYSEIRNASIYRLKNTTWIEVDAEQPLDEVVGNINSLIGILQKHELHNEGLTRLESYSYN